VPHLPPTSLVPSGRHSAENPTRSQRRPLAQSASLLHAEPLAPVPPATHVFAGPQYMPAVHSSLMTHVAPVGLHWHGWHVPALHASPVRQSLDVPHATPTPTPFSGPPSGYAVSP
jgi:hypothetical protein